MATHLHNVFAAALKHAPDAERPAPPHHASGAARPVMANVGYLAVALHALDNARPAVADRRRCEAWATIAREIYARHELRVVATSKLTSRGSSGKTLTRQALTELQRRVSSVIGGRRRYEIVPGQSAPLTVANAAALVGYFTEVGNPTDAATRIAVTRTIEILTPKRGAVRRYLTELDAVIVREDMRLARLQRPCVIFSMTRGVLKMMPSSVRRNVSKRSSDAVYARS